LYIKYNVIFPHRKKKNENGRRLLYFFILIYIYACVGYGHVVLGACLVLLIIKLHLKTMSWIFSDPVIFKLIHSITLFGRPHTQKGPSYVIITQIKKNTRPKKDVKCIAYQRTDTIIDIALYLLIFIIQWSSV
jgi:hypothetical protein